MINNKTKLGLKLVITSEEVQLYISAVKAKRQYLLTSEESRYCLLVCTTDFEDPWEQDIIFSELKLLMDMRKSLL